jgi:hypothetical protein
MLGHAALIQVHYCIFSKLEKYGGHEKVTDGRGDEGYCAD